MAAYVLLIRENPVRDAAEMKLYQEKGRQNPPDPKLTPLVVYGKAELLEGGPLPDGVVILQFPSVEDAKAWYYSPAYQAAAKHRLNAAEYRSMIIEGFAAP
jgi:uncharacterized protein (DUF1330 family)